MNRNDIITNRLYDGREILIFAKMNIFREGDELIAIQDDMLSKYIFKRYPNGSFDFVDEDYQEESLDMFDLINCKFIILFKKEECLKVAKMSAGIDTELFVKKYNEVMKEWFKNNK